MDKPEITITLDNVSDGDWIKLNYNSIGLYRVKYEWKTLERLNEPISSKTISPQDRLMIQNDVVALCNAGHQSFVDYLKLLPFYKNEDNFTVWKSIGTIIPFFSLSFNLSYLILASNITSLSSLLEYTNYSDEFMKYRLSIFSPIQKRLGWDAKSNEDPLSAMLRPIILTIVGKSGDEEVIKEAKERFERHVNGDLVDPNIRGAVYILASRYGNETTQESLRKVKMSIIFDRPFYKILFD